MFVYITTIWWSWLPVIKSDMLKSRLGEREHTCVCWWSSDYPWGAGGPFIGSLPHISALSIFFETSQCLHRKRFQFPASDVLGHTPATWIWGIWLKGMEGATVEAVDFEFSCLQSSCLCGSVSSEKTLGLLLDLENTPCWIPPTKAPPLSGLSVRLALGGPFGSRVEPLRSPDHFFNCFLSCTVCWNVWCVVFIPFLFVLWFNVFVILLLLF